MMKPDSDSSTQHVSHQLRRAEAFDRNRQWVEGDLCFREAVAADTSPSSRIAYANSLATREQYNEAICQMTLALDLATESGNREALGIIFHNLASIYRELGDAKLASRFQQRAILQWNDCGPAELLGLANDAWLAGRTELAACLAGSCLDSNPAEDILESQATSAVIAGLTEDPRSGIRTLIEVYRQHQSAGEYRLMGIDLLNVAALVAELGWYRREVQFVKTAIQHFDQASAPVSAAKARRRLTMLERMRSLRDFDPSMN